MKNKTHSTKASWKRKTAILLTALMIGQGAFAHSLPVMASEPLVEEAEDGTIYEEDSADEWDEGEAVDFEESNYEEEGEEAEAEELDTAEPDESESVFPDGENDEAGTEESGSVSAEEETKPEEEAEAGTGEEAEDTKGDGTEADAEVQTASDEVEADDENVQPQTEPEDSAIEEMGATEEASQQEQIEEGESLEETVEEIEDTEETDVLSDGTYNVVFDANCGKFGSDTTKKVSVKEDVYVNIDDYQPTRSGFKLSGWSETKTSTYPYYYAGDGDSLCPSDEVSEGGTVTLYAVWTPTITLDANGGKFSDGKTKIVPETWSGYYYFGNNTPTRNGYALLGWATSASATTAVYREYGSVTVTKGTTFYAVWKKVYTITLNGNGGKFGTETTKKITTSSTYVWLDDNVPTRSGYQLKGWSSSKNGAVEYAFNRSIESATISKNMTLYAIWAKEVKVVFKANGGTFPEGAHVSGAGSYTLSSDKKTLTAKVAQGNVISIYSSSVPTKSKVAFRGWGASAKATEPVEGSNSYFNISVSSNKTYYAVWATAIAVTFKATGAMTFYSNGKYVTSLSVPVAKGDTLSGYVPSVYIKTTSGGNTSYNYLGSSDTKWGTSASTKVANAFFAENYKITGKGTFYPVNAKTVKITWNANGGKVGTQNNTSETKAFASRVYSYSKPSYSGKTFIGWSTSKKAAGLVDFSNTVYALKNTTYYAVWESGYKITIKGNGGTFTSCNGGTLSKDLKTMTAYVRKGEALFDAFSFEVNKNGKRYNGLATTATGKAIANPWSYRPSGNMTLYAVDGSMREYEITYDANGGVFSDGTSKKVIKEEAGDYPWASATRTGYELLGWYTAKSKGKKVEEVTKAMTLYAHWKKGITVVWNANGGSFSRTSYKTKNTDYVSKNTLLKDIRHTVYSSDNNKGFAGWSLSKNGKVIDINTYKVTRNINLYAIWEKGDDIADGRIELTKKRFVYAGKPVKPAITVYDRSGKKVSAGKYTVTYEDNDGPGTGKIQVRGKEGKGGTLRMSFRINYDARSNVSSAKVTKKNVKVSYSKASYAAEYMVYAQNKTTGAKKSVLSKTTSATIKSLAKGSYEIYVIPYAKYGDGEGTYSSDRGAGKMKTVTIK